MVILDSIHFGLFVELRHTKAPYIYFYSITLWKPQFDLSYLYASTNLPKHGHSRTADTSIANKNYFVFFLTRKMPHYRGVLNPYSWT